MATRRSQVSSRHNGNSASNPIVVDGTQESQTSETSASDQSSSHSDSTTTSSHNQESQATDGTYDAETQPIGSQGVHAELDAIIDDPGAADVDMAHFQATGSLAAAGTQQPNPTAAAANTTPLSAGDDNPPQDADESYHSTGSDGPGGQMVTFADPYHNPAFCDLTWDQVKAATESFNRDAPPSRSMLISAPRSFNPSNLDNVRELIRHILKRWKSYYKGAEPVQVIPLPATGAHRKIIITFINEDDFRKALANPPKFYWDRQLLPVVAWGANLKVTDRIVTAHLPPTMDAPDAMSHFSDQLAEGLKVIAGWSLRSGPAECPAFAVFTGHIVVVVRAIRTPGMENTRLSHEDLTWFPAFVRVAGIDYETKFVDRPDWCRDCRSRATHFHTGSDCPNPWC
ncbi:hypothetical protein V8E36_001508, partial [Tilletia maclaganii]